MMCRERASLIIPERSKTKGNILDFRKLTNGELAGLKKTEIETLQKRRSLYQRQNETCDPCDSEGHTLVRLSVKHYAER